MNSVGALVAALCAVLLLRAFCNVRKRLLLWSGLCFTGLAISNALAFVDLQFFSVEADLYPYRLSIIVCSSFVAGTFFLKFWRQTHDLLFWHSARLSHVAIYLIRLFCYLLILGAIEQATTLKRGEGASRPRLRAARPCMSGLPRGRSNHSQSCTLRNPAHVCVQHLVSTKSKRHYLAGFASCRASWCCSICPIIISIISIRPCMAWWFFII